MSQDPIYVTLVPLASVVVGFLFALLLFNIKEWSDRRAKAREAQYYLLFFLKVLVASVKSRTKPTTSGGFDEVLKRLASARVPFYDWGEMSDLNDFNAMWVAGSFVEYGDLTVPLGKLANLSTMLEQRLGKI